MKNPSTRIGPRPGESSNHASSITSNP
jgi:hypothetical protein